MKDKLVSLIKVAAAFAFAFVFILAMRVGIVTVDYAARLELAGEVTTSCVAEGGRQEFCAYIAHMTVPN